MKNRLRALFGMVVLLSGCVPVNQEHADWADRIYLAGQAKQSIAPLTVERDISVEEAYQIQQIYDDLMKRTCGAVTGYKVAYASKASQQKWKIEAPTFGTFLEKQYIENGGLVKADDFILFHIESEVAFTLSADIREPLNNVESLMPYLKSVHIGFDVPDNRFDKSKGPVKVADVIAMSCATHTYVLGEGVDPNAVDYTTMQLTLEHDGEEVYAGAASNVMGDPREAVLALVKHLEDQGSYLKAGDVVLSGSVAGAYCPKTIEDRKGVYVGKATGLPPVTMMVE